MADTIQMLEKKFGYFPKSFKSGGQTHAVESVERCWTQTGRAPRLYFRVRTAAGDFTLWQDVNANTWHKEV